MASYGSSVCGRSTVSDAARKYESMGYRVVGGINGDFYDTATGYPLGILISEPARSRRRRPRRSRLCGRPGSHRSAW